jgi:hypothetical protein
MTGLFDMLSKHWDLLVSDVANGRITFAACGQSQIPQLCYRPLAERADELRSLHRNGDSLFERITAIWPSLSLISCWADGPSRVYANQLRKYLGDIELQPKGLLATEAIVTVPRVDCAGSSLAVRSNFFEFLPTNPAFEVDKSPPLCAHELALGERYRVVVTTDGGLYRYQLHDEVEVVGFYHEVPLLQFLGKTDDVSDLVGEKLHAAHVQSVLQSAFCEFGLQPTFAQLYPRSSEASGYVLQLTVSGLESNSQLQSRLSDSVEIGLATNPGYKYARETAQLRPLQLELIDQIQANQLTAHQLAECELAGQRFGDIKASSFRTTKTPH